MSKKALAHLCQDTRLNVVIKSTKLSRHTTNGDVYAALIKAIVSQQLSGKAASTIHGRLLDLFDDRYPITAQLLKMNEAQLTGVGLSRQKSNYIRNVAAFWVEKNCGQIDWSSLPDEEVIRFLTQIKGVGLWTTQMILMFTLQRQDVFPVNDLGIRNAMIKLYRLRSQGSALDKRLISLSKAWSPYRTLASRYLWRWLDGAATM